MITNLTIRNVFNLFFYPNRDKTWNSFLLSSLSIPLLIYLIGIDRQEYSTFTSIIDEHVPLCDLVSIFDSHRVPIWTMVIPIKELGLFLPQHCYGRKFQLCGLESAQPAINSCLNPYKLTCSRSRTVGC